MAVKRLLSRKWNSHNCAVVLNVSKWFCGSFRKWLTDWLLVANLYQVILRLSVMRNTLLLESAGQV